MKKIIFTSLLLAIFSLSTTFAQVGIGTTTPNASAILDVESTEKGFLPPRLTTAERDLIANPAIGLVIYNTTVKCLQWYIGGRIWHNACGNNVYLQYLPNTVFCPTGPTAIVDVLNTFTGKTWMDRNLGASRAATSSTDANAYGDLYQWGRRSDGHQCRTSPTTSITSDTDQPAHGDFITGSNDWRTTRNDNLWQGVNGVNNPCPSGYRLPTSAELDAERLSWVQPPINSTNGPVGAFASPLKLTLGGYRAVNGGLGAVNNDGLYWSSSFAGTLIAGQSFNLLFSIFSSNGALVSPWGERRAQGFSVRCIKD